jgi:cytochrome P450
MRHNDERGMTRPEIELLTSTIVIAGSETSATLLSGAVYYLLKNPAWFERLQLEVRDAFPKESQITFTTVAHLKTLNAVIYETFRMYPPVSVALPRIVPKKGATVSGIFFPPGTRIGIPQYAAYRSPRNFTNPETFAPDRFMENEVYAHDKRSIIQPFSVGPRNCIGQTLAWAEMRTILSRLVWNFDMELVDPSKVWENQKTFVLWDKPSLMVKLKVREGAD